MSPSRRFYSRVSLQRMLTTHICWRKRHNVLFSVIVFLFCITFFAQKIGTFDKTRGFKPKVPNGDFNDYNYSQVTQMLDGAYDERHTTSQSINQNEEVDVVYTWVNGSDPTFIKDFENLMQIVKKNKPTLLALNRYNDWGTLKYSLRSVEQYAPWIRNIHLVTNGQVPYWMALDNPRIRIVTHKEIFTNKSDLPAFTSPAIECHIHKIKGLSKRFIYLNDDILITSKLQFEDFYTETEGYKLRFFHERLEHCNKLCPANNVNNGVCEKNCTSESCEFDGDDCLFTAMPDYPGPDKSFMFDSWAGSLMHTHFLFNKAFGPQDRYIPEHTAHLFDKTILSQLMKEFPEDWKRTSSTKVRHHLTIQPEFAYYNYLKMLEQTDSAGVKTTSIWSKKDAEKIDFILNNKSPVELKLQIRWCKREVTLKRPKFLVFSDHFNKELSEKERHHLQLSLTGFMSSLFPKPSEFEIT